MAEPIKKEDIKEALTEALEPFAGAIKEDFNRADERFNKIEATLIAIVEDLKDARKERQNLEKRINETYNAVDGFIENGQEDHRMNCLDFLLGVAIL